MKSKFNLILVILLSLFTLLPFFNKGFFPMHDDTQVSRVFEMGKSLQDGMIPVRWVKDLGYAYGYPIFNFYAPLSYYVGGAMQAVGTDALLATKIMMIAGILLSGIFMYAFARKIFGEWGGVVAALFYIYAPYHALDIYVRGDVGEFWAYAFIPLVFWGAYEIFSGGKFKGFLLGSIGIAAVTLSHNLTMFMLIPFFAIFPLFFLGEKQFSKKLLYFIGTGLLGVALSAFYWFPALAELSYTNVSSQIGGAADFRNHFVCISQLWDSPWSFGGSVPGCGDGLSFRLGKLHILVAIFAAALFIYKKGKPEKRILLFSFFGIVVSLFLTLEQSRFIWEKIPSFSYLQYPWRFLIFGSFFSSLLAGSIPFLFKDMYKKYLSFVAGLLIVGVIFLNGKLFNPQTINGKTSADYTSLQVLRFDISKISDEYMPSHFKKPTAENQVPKERIRAQGLTVNVITDKTNLFKAQIEASKNVTVTFNFAYFPAWHVNLDGKLVQPIDGTYRLNIPKGKHTIVARFIETSVEKLGDILSLAGLMVFVIAIIQKKKYE